MDGRTRAFFFHVISVQNPRLDFALLFEALKELTENGKNVTDLEEAAGPLLLRWIRHPILTTLSGGGSGGGGGGKGTSDGPGNESQRDPLASLSHPASPNINNNNNNNSSSTSGNDVDNFEDVLVEFLSFLINIFKFNSAYLDEEVVSGGDCSAGVVWVVTRPPNRSARFLV